MPRSEQRAVVVLELVVACERETDTLGTTLVAALTDELPARSVLRVDFRRQVANSPVHFSEQFSHDMLSKSRLE
jgi:hypothetical protein